MLYYEHYMYGLTVNIYLYYHLFSLRDVIILQIHMSDTNTSSYSWSQLMAVLPLSKKPSLGGLMDTNGQNDLKSELYKHYIVGF